MIGNQFGARRLATAAFALAGLAGAASATTVSLGSITAARTVSESSFVAGKFDDTFSFVVPERETLSFSAMLNTDPFALSASKFLFQGLTVELLKDGSAFLFGNGGPSFLSGRPVTVMEFPATLLDAGDYTLQISGTESFLGSSIPVVTSYAGNLKFADVALSVPEPASILLWLAVVALGTAAVRRRRGA